MSKIVSQSRDEWIEKKEKALDEGGNCLRAAITSANFAIKELDKIDEPKYFALKEALKEAAGYVDEGKGFYVNAIKDVYFRGFVPVES